MKILYVVRLFSGLETSLLEGRWRPTGAPTSYRLIEALDRGPHEVEFVLACQDRGSPWAEPRDRTMRVDGLSRPLTVLAGEESFPAWLGKTRRYLRMLRHLLWIRRRLRHWRPDLLYIGHNNIWAGGLLARTQGISVVLRIMGIYPVMREALDGQRPAYRLLRWCYRAPWAAVIATEDGSGIAPWLARALGPGVPAHEMLNGVDRDASGNGAVDPRLAALPAGRTVVLFVGSLQPAKGCEEFLRAFLAARDRAPGALHALIVGRGPLWARLQQTVANAGAADEVTMIERLPHDQIADAHARADIYVSLNRLGNLSNANLEAMAAGQCMIFPEAQPETGVDLATDRFVPVDAAIRIPSADAVDALGDAILRLHREPEFRRAMGERMRAVADGFIPDWDRRVATEIALLDSLAGEPR